MVAGRVGSHSPGSAPAGTAGEMKVTNSPVTRVAIQASLIRRIRLWRIAPRSIIDIADDEGCHAAGAHRRNTHLQTDVGRLEHLTLAEVDRHVLAAARAVEDHVATTHLRGRDL